jgi:hypothetical protein
MLVDFFKKIKNKLVLGLWNMIPDFEIFGVSVKGKLASVMGLDIPGIEAEIAKSEAEETAATEKLKIEKAKANKEENIDALTDEASPNQIPFPTKIDIEDTNKDPFPEDADESINPINYESVDGGVDSNSQDLVKLKQATDESNKLLYKQLEILDESKRLLAELANKISNINNNNNSVVSTNNTVTNVFQTTSIRDLQRAYT